MSGRIIAAAALLAAITGACGASSQEVKKARTAEYKCDQQRVFTAVVESMKEQFPPLAGMNEAEGVVVSDMRWHDRYGTREKEGAAVVREGSVMVGAEALVKQGASGGWVVLARARVFGQEVGSPRGREYAPEDPLWPPWVNGKLDNLFIKIHGKLVPGCENLTVEPK